MSKTAQLEQFDEELYKVAEKDIGKCLLPLFSPLIYISVFIFKNPG